MSKPIFTCTEQEELFNYLSEEINEGAYDNILSAAMDLFAARATKEGEYTKYTMQVKPMGSNPPPAAPIFPNSFYNGEHVRVQSVGRRRSKYHGVTGVVTDTRGARVKVHTDAPFYVRGRVDSYGQPIPEHTLRVDRSMLVKIAAPEETKAEENGEVEVDTKPKVKKGGAWQRRNKIGRKRG